MSDYPVPRYAVSVWVAGDRLWAAFPPLVPGEHGHSVPFPNNEKGMQALVLTLRHRNEKSTVGTKGSPCKHEIEFNLSSDVRYKEWLKAMNANEEEQQNAEKFLQNLGL